MINSGLSHAGWVWWCSCGKVGTVFPSQPEAMQEAEKHKCGMNKYGAVRTEVDGFKFDSGHEANRYVQLRILESSGEISGLELQVPFRCEVNGKLVCTYIADFRYCEGDKIVIEDAKGKATPEYKLKKRLVEALHGITITEV